ncbi:thiamine diphosphokinase [Fodinibius sp.]|uniref:thiamine diphosphokinase n=1 Tax=Fodinibius sp. TaxID=1872440 RepID=UPI002ACEFBB1|nr:thiamine diphosphokinase [Fodinibius sp.]MDZ7659955.1 thiamine diphosphokinase [Fodinibius sp.]
MKSILILCNGSPPSEQLFNKYRAKTDYFIAADGGANIAQKLGATPDVIIGDLDSYNGSEKEKSEVIFRPNQEYNDLEKALQHALKENGTHIYILGATGHRLDQTLKNLSVLKQFSPQFQQIRIADNFGETRLLPPTFADNFTIGTQLSLFPLSGKVTGITTQGLKYPLDNEFIKNGVRDGSSNEVVANPVQITHKKGDLLMFVKHNNN